MSDPISIVGLVIAVTQVIRNLYDYGKSVKDAQSDISRLVAELLALKGVLENLQEMFSEKNEGQSNNPTLSLEFQNLATSSLNILETLEKQLEAQRSKLKRAMQALKWPFDESEMERQMRRLERVKSSFILIVMTGNVLDSQDILSTIKQLDLDLQEDRERAAREKLEESNRQLLQWLAPSSSTWIHSKACDAHYPETGRWFQERFEQWISNSKPTSSILWLSGSSGSGKTIIFSQMIEYLQSEYQTRDDAAIMYHYCSFDDAASQVPENVFGQALSQLSRKTTGVLDELRPLFRKHQQDSDFRRRSLDILLAKLESHIRNLRIAFLLLDATNESTSSREIHLSVLRLARELPNLRVVITSTTVASISELSAYPNLVQIGMEPKDVDSDIETFVSANLESDTELSRLNTTLKNDIKRSLIGKANGT